MHILWQRRKFLREIERIHSVASVYDPDERKKQITFLFLQSKKL